MAFPVCFFGSLRGGAKQAIPKSILFFTETYYFLFVSYCIAGKFGEVLNLAIDGLEENCQIKPTAPAGLLPKYWVLY